MTQHEPETRAPAGFRLPPHNIDAEQALLGTLLAENSAYQSVSEFLRPDHFYEPVHARIYASIQRLIDSGRRADHRMLRLEFESDEALRELDGASYLLAMMAAAALGSDAESYGHMIHDLALKRALITIGAEIVNRAHDPTLEETGGMQIQNAQGLLDRLALDQPVEAWLSLDQVIDGICSRLSGPAECFSTGMPTLDQSMVGGIQPGLCYGIEARVKQFKTGVAGTIALSLMRQSVPFLYVALEMGAGRIVERLISHETHCNAVRFRKQQDPEDLLSRATTFLHQFSGRRAYFANEPGLSFDRLTRLANAAVTKLGIKVLFVDYWQRITGSSGTSQRMNKADFLNDVAQWLASWAASQNCALVLMSQENRTGESFGSDGLAQACDWLAVLHKVDVTDKLAGDFEGLWMDVKFNRDGADSPLGSAQRPAFRIDKIGPVLREFDDWSNRR